MIKSALMNKAEKVPPLKDMFETIQRKVQLNGYKKRFTFKKILPLNF